MQLLRAPVVSMRSMTRWRLPAGVRAAVPGRDRRDQLAAVRADPAGLAGPHQTTLMKVTTRCGPDAVDGLNEALLAKAAAAKVLHQRAAPTHDPGRRPTPTPLQRICTRPIGSLGRVRCCRPAMIIAIWCQQ